MLRGVEIYRGKPIFYSLGDFIFQNETVELQPADNYEAYMATVHSDEEAAMWLRDVNFRLGRTE